MKAIWTRRIGELAARYGENAPAAATCCNACRTCATTNIVTLLASLGVAGIAAGRRLVSRAF